VGAGIAEGPKPRRAARPQAASQSRAGGGAKARGQTAGRVAEPCWRRSVQLSDCPLELPDLLTHPPTQFPARPPARRQTISKMGTLPPRAQAPHPLTPSPPHPLTPSLPHPLTPSLPHSLTPSLPPSLPPSLTRPSPSWAPASARSSWRSSRTRCGHTCWRGRARTTRFGVGWGWGGEERGCRWAREKRWGAAKRGHARGESRARLLRSCLPFTQPPNPAPPSNPQLPLQTPVR
jgi:hypothetical protein